MEKSECIGETNCCYIIVYHFEHFHWTLLASYVSNGNPTITYQYFVFFFVYTTQYSQVGQSASRD